MHNSILVHVCVKEVDFNCNSSYEEKSNEISHYIHIIFLGKKNLKVYFEKKKNNVVH